jgi:hypothetical protein
LLVEGFDAPPLDEQAAENIANTATTARMRTPERRRLNEGSFR